ncbi:hypothetical protein ACFQ9U_15575 [Streptomyces sp. NPDC056568]|uniref:hypothetical protein n=1 Tax=Streptomyces sp. NPDC056568 TaxID=3345866 RepID=UPI00367468E9
MPTSITLTSEFSGSVVAKGATDDLSAQLLRHAGFKQIDDWHGRRHRLPTTTPLADQVAIASHAAEMLRAARYDVTLPPSLDTARMSPPVHALGPYAAGAELLSITDQIRAAEDGASLQAAVDHLLHPEHGALERVREALEAAGEQVNDFGFASETPMPNYAASAPLRRATPQPGPSVITVVPLWPLLLRRTRPRSTRHPIPSRRLALRRVTHRAPQPPDADLSRSLHRRQPVRRAPPLDSPVKDHSPEEANVPEYYSSIGEAVGAAMRHNIRLAHHSAAPGSDKPLQVRHLPSASTDPYTVRGMISRLHEDASPDEVAGIIEEVNGALVGALPELTELVASAADWTRARLDFDDPHHNPTFETWTRLAAAYGMLQDVREQLEVAEDGLAACPAERTDRRHHQMVNVLRSRELLDDVLGAEAAPVPSAAQNVDSDRQRAVRASSPRAGTSPSTGSPPATAAPPPAPRSAGRPR